MAMGNRAQAGLEYLMTYGWALVLIATVVGVLIFIVGAPAQEAQFTSSAPNKFLLKSDAITDEGIAMVVLQNITGGPLTIGSIVEDGSLSDCTIDAGDGPGASGIAVNAGATMLLECPYAGSGSGSATINYTNFANLAQVAVIGVGGGTGTTGPACTPIGSEVCTGSIDEDCDGLVDCADPDCAANPACLGSLGDACTLAGDCASGNCTDGVCCNSACSGSCFACNLAGTVGTCTQRPYGDATECAAPNRCNTVGTCVGCGLGFFWDSTYSACVGMPYMPVPSASCNVICPSYSGGTCKEVALVDSDCSYCRSRYPAASCYIGSLMSFINYDPSYGTTYAGVTCFSGNGNYNCSASSSGVERVCACNLP